MKTIYKYVLDTVPNVVGAPKIPYQIELPQGAKVLSCGIQGGHSVCVWALVDPDVEEKVKTNFYVIGTGWPLSPELTEGWAFLNTIMVEDGVFVYHVFVEVDPSNYSLPISM